MTVTPYPSNGPKLLRETETGNFSVEDALTQSLFGRENSIYFPANESNELTNLLSSTTTSQPKVILNVADPNHHLTPNSEETLINRSSVLFVAVSFILLMVISLAWLVFYYVQRFRYLHSKERVSRRLAELAKKAVARIPVKTLQPGDRETTSESDQCAICIEPYRQLDTVRILPCRHYFHKVCIDPWLLEQRSCPMCKLDILQAYGLRSEFFLTTSSGETVVGASGTHVPVIAGPHSGFASSGCSDDGMERVALIHDPSRFASGSGGASIHAPLTYVVLTTAATTDMSSLYYVRRSSSEIPLNILSRAECHNFDPPADQLAPQSAATATTSRCFLWNSGPNFTASSLPRQASSGQMCMMPNWSLPIINIPPPHLIATAISESSPPVTTASSAVPQSDVTSTTQAFRTPVCSVVPEHQGQICLEDRTVARQHDHYSTEYDVGVPSIDILRTRLTSPCPVTIPISVQADQPSRPFSNQASSLWNPFHTPALARLRARSTVSPLSAGLFTWFRHSRRRGANQNRISTGNAVTMTSSLPATHNSVTHSLLQPEPLVSDTQPCAAGSEQVVVAMVETEPYGVAIDEDGVIASTVTTNCQS